MLRGGSWNNNPNNMRCANRNRNNPTNRNNNIGFRCVQDAEYGCQSSIVYGQSKRAYRRPEFVPVSFLAGRIEKRFGAASSGSKAVPNQY
ncbi:SUMF1/EgtB/PvdO family nonheme iron enzyme [candidate division KSB1 bacterium]|nr:SUMF1/EgtB/PvdO family nonheme iron enzyme [candidate division KSB1 bacterium]NIS23533.1 SUMF1/EgtB/PvdO family nonheme iron enzyme [candidate division KSB1 bacterium]NIT73475.1 SUMF1/EgtB/PvdO family nonheme iron enzyme [candidate division KSB1 bacterium]NIU28775.1 SUMF1/EgtB/PvdO family nonheme iron enzyme [candidate division KSB1 bacterium]NIU93459.1 SUMF1/EgtB/PvdO family nonheme iron enzyme [candidate division KSB1 bacterium]